MQATTREEELGGGGVGGAEGGGAAEERELVLISYQIYRDQRRPVVAIILFQPAVAVLPHKMSVSLLPHCWPDRTVPLGSMNLYLVFVDKHSDRSPK